MLTKQKLTTTIGYLKYRSRAEAARVARKLDLSGTHSHETKVNGRTQTIYMPSNSHSALNSELQKRGLPKTMVPVSGASMGAMGDGGFSQPDPMSDAGLEPADDMALNDGMFDLEMEPGEDERDPMNMAEMGMDQQLFGEIEMTGDEDDDGDMEIY
jgi:hypothetical protein